MKLKEKKEKIANEIMDLTGFDMYDVEVTTRGFKMFYEALTIEALEAILSQVKEKGFSCLLKERFYYKLRNALTFGGFAEEYADEHKTVYRNKVTNEQLEIRRI